MKKIVLMCVLLVGAILFMPDVSSTYIYNPDAGISYTLNETDTSSGELFTGVGTITYQDGDITITILDRNLGATATGSCGDLDFRTNKCSNTPSPLSYGYKFQRGNNWGFDSNKLIDSISGLVSSALVSPGYSTGILYEGNYGGDTSWIDEYRPDLWGGDDYIEYDWNNYKLSLENAEKKQGPCPDGWHIPTYYEMSQIIHQAPLLFNSKELFLPEKDLGWFSETGYYGYKYGRETGYSGYKYGRVKNDHGVRFEYSNVSSNSLHPIRCFYNYYELYPRVVSAYDEGAMMWSGLVDAGSAISGDIVTQYLTGLTKQGYTFNGRLISGSNEEFDPENDIVTTGLILNADRTINQYTITFNTDGGSEVAPITGDYGTGITKPDDPTKNGYTFDGWKPSIPETMPAENLTITAQWKKKSGGWSGGGGGGGGSGSSSSHGSADDNTPQGTGDSQDSSADKSASEGQTGSVVDSSAEPQNDSSVSSGATAKDLEGEELFNMHQWAYDNGLTIYKPGEDAKFDKPLTRQQMAKISSIFGAKFLNQKADDSEGKIMECSQYKDLSKSKGEMRGYVIQSCLMKNMGYAYDGVNLIKKFRPYDKLTVAQASVILSRMAWGDKYVISPKRWYQGHMKAVYDHGLIDDISNPQREVTRGEAFMMMYRLSQMMETEKQ